MAEAAPYSDDFGFSDEDEDALLELIAGDGSRPEPAHKETNLPACISETALVTPLPPQESGMTRIQTPSSSLPLPENLSADDIRKILPSLSKAARLEFQAAMEKSFGLSSSRRNEPSVSSIKAKLPAPLAVSRSQYPGSSQDDPTGSRSLDNGKIPTKTSNECKLSPSKALQTESPLPVVPGKSSAQSSVAQVIKLASSTVPAPRLASLGWMARALLKEHFGYDKFRLEQEAAVVRLLAGENTLVVFPTGGGKSLCYQIPAIAFPILDKQSQTKKREYSGITLVISPLLALMKDQVDTLKRLGIKAASLNSALSTVEFKQVMTDLKAGQLNLLYCAPERLNNEGFLESMKFVRGGIRMVAVDEAHCISEWGHAFRPDYLKIARFVEEIQAERVVCLTATATPKVAQDICNAFNIEPEGLFETPSYRSNLELIVKGVDKKAAKFQLMKEFIRTHPGATIVYVTQQMQSEELAAYLNGAGFSSQAFHAGLETKKKTATQDMFMSRDDLIICATIAFGMGIDKSNIRNIIHFDLPSSIEEYSQQIGRAGRDGLPSTCLLFLCNDDFSLKESFIYSDLPSEQSVLKLLQTIFSGQNQHLKPGRTFVTNHHEQSSLFDIKLNTLGNIYAQLEMQSQLIRETSPQYASYEYTLGTNAPSMTSDKSPAAEMIRKHSKLAKTNYHFDINAAVASGIVFRGAIVQKLNQWHEDGAIMLKVAGIRHVYRVVKTLPATPQQLETLSQELYSGLQAREQQEIGRLHSVTALLTSEGCLARKLAEYFQPHPAVPAQCHNCSWCKTRNRPSLAGRKTPPKDLVRIKKVLSEVLIRDDPRFLARIAFGINSPRAVKLKLKDNEVFGSLTDHDFPKLLKEFERACRADGFVNQEASTSGTKRKAAPLARSGSAGTIGAKRRTGGGYRKSYSYNNRGTKG